MKTEIYSGSIMIRQMKRNDAEKVLEIYADGLETGNATFETKIPSWIEWDRNHHTHSRFVYEEQGTVIGWAALSPVSKRKAYNGVAEVSIYISENSFGKGIGKQLMRMVIDTSETNGIWSLFSSLFPENEASIRIHKKCGFRKIGTRERIAQRNGVWRDTVIMERRSQKVGIS